MVDRTFFDAPGEAQDEEYAFAADRELPEGWRKVRQDDWLVCTPEGTRRPAQGWKVHASGCHDNAEKILDAVHNFFVPRGIPFKFLRGQHILQLRNMKYAARGASGKLVTIYPADERELREVLEGVDALVGGEPGPYILSGGSRARCTCATAVSSSGTSSRRRGCWSPPSSGPTAHSSPIAACPASTSPSG
jgi:hypothetical protein